MLLQAMAETVRAEMVARSITRSPLALLFRLYTMYQPGGESEKAYILQYLVTPPKAQTAVEMVATLRQWERMLLRADNISIAKPDPSLLVRGLNALVGDVWAKDRDVTFRTQLVKSRLGVDVSPTWESALQLHQHLRAEAENMVHALPTTTKPAVGDGQRDPKLRPLQPNQPQGATNLAKASSTTPPTTSTASAATGGTGEKKCKWFTEPQGCRRGANCKFVHSFQRRTDVILVALKAINQVHAQPRQRAMIHGRSLKARPRRRVLQELHLQGKKTGLVIPLQGL